MFLILIPYFKKDLIVSLLQILISSVNNVCLYFIKISSFFFSYSLGDANPFSEYIYSKILYSQLAFCLLCLCSCLVGGGRGAYKFLSVGMQDMKENVPGRHKTNEGREKENYAQSLKVVGGWCWGMPVVPPPPGP